MVPLWLDRLQTRRVRPRQGGLGFLPARHDFLDNLQNVRLPTAHAMRGIGRDRQGGLAGVTIDDLRPIRVNLCDLLRG
jgi:hypothetical protein